MGCVVATTFLDTARLVAKITGYIHPRYHHSKYRKILFYIILLHFVDPSRCTSVLSVHREAMSVLSSCASLGFRMIRVFRCLPKWCEKSSYDVVFYAFSGDFLSLHIQTSLSTHAPQ